KSNLILSLRIAFHKYHVLICRRVALHRDDRELYTCRPPGSWSTRHAAPHYRACNASETRRLQHLWLRSETGCSNKTYNTQEGSRKAAFLKHSHKHRPHSLLRLGVPRQASPPVAPMAHPDRIPP